ncbi:MAG: hypothetical protein CBD76_01775 [Pelagibacteraceae bacterium TMED216]|nr:MAG: hypothetical protein CBD76_01775 [Pelagibacteraceae bacterium TMED216]
MIKDNNNDKDKKDWEEFVKNPKDIFDKDIQDTSRLFKSTFKFDLHGYSLEQANKKVKEIIVKCVNDNYKEILLITGKGLHSKTDNVYSSKNFSKLKFSIPEFLRTDKEISKYVNSISSADKNSGGEGALLLKLNLTKE